MTESTLCLILAAAADHLFASQVSLICSHVLRRYVMDGLPAGYFISTSFVLGLFVFLGLRLSISGSMVSVDPNDGV